MFFYQISTLTTGQDKWIGGAQNDMFTAPRAGVTNEAKTLTAGDILDGGDGEDTLILDAQGTVVTGLQTVKNIENLKVYESAAWTGNVSEFAGLKNVEVTANGAVALTAGVSVTDVTVLNTGGAAGTAATTLTGDGIATVTARNLASTASNTLTVENTTAKHTLNVALDKVGEYVDGGTNKVLSIVDTHAETIALTSNGLTNVNVAAIGNTTANTVLKTVTIAGKGDLVLDLNGTKNTAVTTIDGAKAEGDLDLTGIAATTKTITTGAGDDEVTLVTGAVSHAGSTVSLGAGDDTLTMKFASLTTNLKLDGGTNTAEGDALIFSDEADFTAAGAAGKYGLVKGHGFEVVGVSGELALKADADKLGVNSFYLENGTSAAAATISNATDGATITFADNTAITGGGVYSASKLDMSASIVNGVVNVNLEAGKGATAGFDVVTVADFTSAGSNTFNVTSTSLGEVNANTIKITGAANSTVKILGDHTVEVTNGNATVGEKTVFNAENFGASMKFTGDAGIDIVTASAFGDTITGGAGADVITLGAGADKLVYAATDSGAITGTANATTHTVVFNAPTAGEYDIVTGNGAGDTMQLSAASNYTAVTRINIPTTNTMTLTAKLDSTIIKIGDQTFFVFETAAGDADTLGACQAIDITGVTATQFAVSEAGVVTFS